MPINNNDKLLVNDGSKTETITFAQFKDGTVLNDTDKFLVNDGSKTETISWAQIQDDLGPKGVVVTPTVLKPEDGAGSGDVRYLKSDAITKIEGGGIKSCETDTIQSVTVNTLSWEGTQFGTPAAGSMPNIWNGTDDSFDIANTGINVVSETVRYIFDNPVPLVGGVYKLKNSGAQPTAEYQDVWRWKDANGIHSMSGNQFHDTGWDVDDFSPQPVGFIEWIEITSNPGFAITNLFIEDNTIDSNDPQFNTTILTFPSSNGFDCFKPGDVVQQSTASGIILVPDAKDGQTNITNAENAVDGNRNTFALTTGSSFLPVEWGSDMSEITLTIQNNNANLTAVYFQPFNADKTDFVTAGNFTDLPAGWTTTSNSGWSNQLNIPANSVKATVKFNLAGVAATVSQEGGRLYSTRSDVNIYSIETDGSPADGVKVVSKDEDANTITVDGGEWKGSDGSGDQAAGDDKLVKETPYDTKLTVASNENLELFTDGVFMTDGSGAPGPYSQTPYKLTTTDIESVGVAESYISVSYSDKGSGLSNDGFLDGQPVENMWDGQTNTYAYSGLGGGNIPGKIIEVRFSELSSNPFASGTFDLEVGILGSGYIVAINGAVSGDLYRSDVSSAQTFTGLSSITTITVSRDFATGQAVIGHFKVNGEFLIATPGGKLLTFPGAVSTNPDLQYFRAGDTIQGSPLVTFDRGNMNGYGSLNQPTVNKLFDGDPDTSCDLLAEANYPTGVPNNDALTITLPTPIPNVTKVEVFGGSSTIGARKAWINDFTWAQGADAATNPRAWFTVYESDAVTLEKLRFGTDETGAGFSPGQVRVNGTEILIYNGQETKVISRDLANNTMTVDGGNWDTSNQSQVWSNHLTTNSNASDSDGPGGFFPSTPRTNVFDGDVNNTYAACTGNDPGDPGRTATITFNATGLGVVITEKVGLVMSATQDVEIVTSDGTFTQPNLPALHPLPSEIACTGTLQTIKVTYQDPNLWGIYIDGKLLVDAGTGSLGDTRVEYQTKGGHGTIVSVNTDNNTLLISNTGDRDNRWIAENKANTDFCVAGPAVIDSPLLTTHVELESSQFATTPADVDGLKEIIWNINGVDQSAGTLNPYRPTGLPLNSQITIKVKHVANSIGESEWSTSTTFTTGASRTLGDYYKAQIAALEAQLLEAQSS